MGRRVANAARTVHRYGPYPARGTCAGLPPTAHLPLLRDASPVGDRAIPAVVKHAYRRDTFNDALQALPKDKRGTEQLPARFINLIGKLYHIEAQARRDEVEVDELGRRRREQSIRVLAEIEALLLANVHAVVPSSLLGQALHYLSSQWPKLKRYVEDGRYSIDNNAQENAIRPFCVGRRAWLFADTMAGAHASANLYSLLQTCQVNGIDGYRYLRALLVALPEAKTADEFAALLPWRLASPVRQSN